MDFTQAISDMRNTPSEEHNKEFSTLFKLMVDENQQVYTTARALPKGYAIDTVVHDGNTYVILYSEAEKVNKPNGSATCKIGLSNLIDSCYANPHIMGIAIDPDDNPVYIQRRELQYMSGKEDPRLADRDWGTGIPQYSESDLMVAEEAKDYAMSIVASKGLEPQGYELLETNNSITTFPDFVVRKDGKMYFVAVDVALAPEMPRLNKALVPQYIEAAQPYNAGILYAPVTFASADELRAQARLALIGDDYIGNFLGFMEIYNQEEQ